MTCKDGGAGGKFSPGSGKTDSSGNFSTNYTLGVKARTVTITCTATGYGSAVFTETAVPGPPYAVKKVSGNLQTGPVNTQLPQALVASVVDAHSNPIPGGVVTFSDGGKGGSFSSSTVTTDASGQAATFYTTSSHAGTVKITATTGSLVPATFTVTVMAPTTISITGGNNQSGAAGTQLPEPLTVLITDSHSKPVPNVTVSFTDGGAGGTFANSNPVVTGSDGTATQVYTLPTLASSISITATATGVSSPAVFTENSVAGPATGIAVTGGNNQAGPAGTTLPQALTVLVTDSYNNPVSGVSVSFSDAGAGGIFANPNPSVTDNTGSATQIYTLPPVAGTVTINATASGVPNPAVFTETGQ